MSKIKQNSIIEPTDEELKVYKELVENIEEEQLGEFANEYFELAQAGKINISFQRFLIDKVIRPIKEGDTIQFRTEDAKIITMFCLVRKQVEEKTYLLFAKVDEETETLYHEEVYLFFVDGVDNIGTEIIDIMPAGEETERILDIMEADFNVQMAEGKNPKEQKAD